MIRRYLIVVTPDRRLFLFYKRRDVDEDVWSERVGRLSAVFARAERKELRARIAQQSERYVRFLQRLDLTDDERAAVAADEAAARKLVQRIDDSEASA